MKNIVLALAVTPSVSVALAEADNRGVTVGKLLRLRAGQQAALLPDLRKAREGMTYGIDDTMECLYVLGEEPLGKAVDPGRLQAHGSVEGLFSLVRKNDKLGPPVMRVGLECDEPLGCRSVMIRDRDRVSSQGRDGRHTHSPSILLAII